MDERLQAPVAEAPPPRKFGVEELRSALLAYLRTPRDIDQIVRGLGCSKMDAKQQLKVLVDRRLVRTFMTKHWRWPLWEASAPLRDARVQGRPHAGKRRHTS